jgi:cobalt-zinc-cadmium efflux system membrane fusion protein
MKRFVLMIPVVWITACAPERPAEATAAPEAPAERRTESATHWTAKTELFVEFPALVAGEDSRFAIHLTRLDDFKPVSAGRSEVRLVYAGGETETFSSDAPSRPGIFGVTVKPPRAGEAAVEIRLDSANLSDLHRLEHIPVFASLAEAPTGEEPATEETIAFLKEQQWSMEFGTAAAETGVLRESLLVPAEVSPRSGGEADVIAPLAGRLAGEALPVLGARVAQGQVLASVIPPAPVPNDRAVLDLAKAEAEAALEYARRDRDRASRLVEAGAAPRKRLEEAATAETIAEARLRAAEQRIRQLEASLAAEAAGSPAFAIRAPVSGTVVAVSASPGMNLKGGETLFHIVDTERVYVSAIVPEADYPKARSVTGAEVEIPGLERPRPAGRLVSIGTVVDPASRTFPVVYEFANPDGRIAINQTVMMRLFLGGSRRGVVAPESALVDDGGRPVVFVQRAGEKFARRPVETGLRESGRVEIVSGVQAGERIVTRGAYLIRLAALSTQIPAHGHVH